MVLRVRAFGCLSQVLHRMLNRGERNVTDTVKWFSDNWAALTKAPWLFVTLAVIVVAVVYAISTWFKNE